jgi:Flp pilus assembly protein TadG
MHMCNANIVKSDRGQIMVIFALVLPILILFAGLAIDAGICYVTKAKLSTSVDAACLTGMKNLTLGQTIAGQLATDMFQANFGPNPPVPTVTFPTDAYGDQQVKVTATANVHTFFIRYLSQWASVPVSALAVSTRGKLAMSIVLDRSGSMLTDGGGAAIQVGVPIFVNDFDDTLDSVALISFSSNTTIDFAMSNHFKTPITNAVKNMNFIGGTFGTGAGSNPVLLTDPNAPPLSMAKLQNDTILPQPGQNLTKAVVYFTDGLMNTVQDKIHCGGKANNTPTLINYGGCDVTGSCDPDVVFLDPTCSPNSSGGCTNESGHVSQWDTCYGSCPSGFKYDYPAGDICKDINGAVVTKFTPQQPGTCYDGSAPPCQFSRQNVTSEAQYRAIQTAIALRTDTTLPTVYIYTIGLNDTKHPMAQSTKDFLAGLANDPNYPLTYIKGQPQGEFFYIPDCPGSNCTPELTAVFQTIAAKILLRLTQ